MKGKKILVYSGGGIFPIGGMHQVRILNQIKSLAKDHIVDYMFLYSKNHHKTETQKGLSDLCRNVIPFRTFTQSFVFRLARKIFLKKLINFLSLPSDHFTLSNTITARSIAKKISKSDYDIIVSHYWHASGFLKYLPHNFYKAIDTHYLVEENLDLYHKGKYSHIDNDRLEKLLNKELYLQNACFDLSDLLIVNSFAQENILVNKGHFKTICIPNGQDLKPYLEYSGNNEEKNKNLLFYGSLSNQFNQKALKRILNNIWPEIRKKYKDVKLIIMGSSPPEWLQTLADDDTSIEVTGFVDDIRPVLQKCTACLLPLESGSGFRGRTVELLASGIPVVGTTNALKSVRISHGVNGIIADTDEELVQWAIKLLADKDLHRSISLAGKEFVMENYSLEATFGKLSEYFSGEIK